MSFPFGAEIVLRLTGHYDAHDSVSAGVAQAWPFFVVEDRADLVALHMPVGTRIERVDLKHRSRRLTPLIHGQHPTMDFRRGDLLRLKEPGSRHSVWLHWSTDDERRFLGWYVNIEAPWIRTRIGFDTTDLALDIVVAPDGRWDLKDDSQVDELTRRGVFTEAERDQIRAEANWVIRRIEAGSAPFDGSWLDWRPAASVERPCVPVDWDLIAGAGFTHFTQRPPAQLDRPYRHRRQSRMLRALQQLLTQTVWSR